MFERLGRTGDGDEQILLYLSERREGRAPHTSSRQLHVNSKKFITILQTCKEECDTQ